MTHFAVFTSGRQDWGILRSTCLLLARDHQLSVIVAGMHLEERHGLSVRNVQADGVPIAAQLKTARSTAWEEAAAVLSMFPPVLAQVRPAALILVGDRSETAAAALAATLARVPLVHLHGGEESEGAIDNALRHSITKLAHLHLVSHPLHARRILQMGEPPESVHVVGAPGLDNALRPDLPDRAALEARLGVTLRPPVVVVTYHPTTLGGEPAAEVAALTTAMADVRATYVVTLPNNDVGWEPVRRELQAFVAASPQGRVCAEQLGSSLFFALMREADAVVGNSSSALIEAPLFALPAVNVGDRQKGRLRASNVLDVPAEPTAIAAALRRALTPEFRASLAGRSSPFGDGHSAEKIVAILGRWRPPDPPRKAFVEQ